MKQGPTLKEQFYDVGRTADCPVYDMHGHMGPNYAIHLPWGDVDSVIRAMDRAGVKMFVFCHHGALLAPDIGNMANVEAVRKYPDRLRAYCGINPNYPDIIDRDLASYDDYSDVYVGLKMLADYHSHPLTSQRYASSWEFADERGLLVLVHTWGGSPNNGASQVRAVAERYPNARILAGHSIHGDWEESVKIASEFSNVYLELCAVLDERGIVERFVSELGSERVVFGTDFPWFDYHYYIGAVLGADITDDDRHNILHRNAEKLLGTRTAR